MAQPKMFTHCARVYECMYEQADEDDDGKVYRGFLSRLFSEELSLPMPYYTPVKRMLEELGCIEQQKRGGGKTPSEWRLFHAPDPNLFDQVKIFDAGRRSSRNSIEVSLATLATRLFEAERQIELLRMEVRGANR